MLKEISSIKISKVTVLKLMVLGLLGVWCLSFGVSSAQERGMGISPAKVTITQDAKWPHAVAIDVANFSQKTEQFEVLFETPDHNIVSASPARFSLEAGARERVLLTFEEPPEATQGLIKVLSYQGSGERFSMGTGVKIPFRIEKTHDPRFLAGAGEAFGALGFGWLFGAGMILATLILLWYLSDIARVWIFNSKRP